MNAKDRIYDIAALSLLYLFLLMPVWGYLIFLGVLPKMRLSLIFGGLAALVFLFRLYLLVTGRRKMPNVQYTLLWVLLLCITLLQLLWTPHLLSRVATDIYLMMVAFTIAAYIFLLGSEPLAFHAFQHSSWEYGIWKMLAIIFGLLLLIVILGIVVSLVREHQILFYFVQKHPKQVYNYQPLADSIAILSILMMARFGRSSFSRIVMIYSVSVLALFFAYSRASLLVYIITGGVLILLYFWENIRKKKIYRFILLASVALIGIFGIMIWQMDGIGASRYFAAMSERYFSTEAFRQGFLGTRASLWNQSIPLLKYYWLWGHFMYEAELFKAGEYIHNWVSFWLEYGILPFTLSLILLFWTFISAIRQRSTSRWGNLTLTLMLYNLLMITLARSYIWRFFWFTLALSIAILAFSRHDAQTQNSLSTPLE